MTYGSNVEVTVENGKKKKRLVIEVDLGAKGEPSRTGKSIVLATTRGNKAIPEAGIVLGLNVYRPASQT